MLVVLSACGEATSDETISGAETGHGEAGSRAGASERAAMGGRGGKAAMPSAGSSERGGSSASDSTPAAGSNAAKTPDEKLLAKGCEFASNDWLTLDGQQLLVSCENELGLIKLTGGSFVGLASPSDPRDIVLSKSRLLYTSTMQLFSVPLDGSEAPPALAINVIDGLQYSLDRAVATFERAENSADQTIPIVAIDSDGKMNERVVVNAGASGSCLSADGRHLVYSPTVGELGLVDVVEPSRMHLLGKGSVGYPHESDRAKAKWSRSSKHFAFFDTENHHIVLAKADGSTVQLGDPFSQEPEAFEFMPNETSVFAIENDFSYAESRTVILGADGKTTEITRGKNTMFPWKISHAGSVLTAQTTDDRSSPELWLRTPQGTNTMLGTLERCTSDDELPIAVQPADGARIAFIDVHGSLIIVDFDTGAPVSETKNVVTVGAACFAAPALSADGTKVLLTSCKDRSFDCSVIVMDAKAEKIGPTLGTGPAGAVMFSKDSRYVAYYDSSSADIVVYATSGGPQLWKGYVEHSDELPQFHWVDSNRFVVARTTSEPELRLVTLR